MTMLLFGKGKFDEAIKVLDSQNPPDINTQNHKIAVYYFSRNYKAAIKESDDMLAKFPNDITTLSYLSLTFPETGDYQKALEAAGKYAALDETVGIGSAVYLGYIYAKAGEKQKAREVLQRIEKKDAPDSAQIHGGLAMLYGALSEKDKAFERIEKSIENREWWAFTLKVAPCYDSLRDDARFGKMLEKVNLAE